MKLKTIVRLLICLLLCSCVMLMASCRGVKVTPSDDGSVTITPNDNEGSNGGSDTNNADRFSHTHTYQVDSSSSTYSCTEGGQKVWRCVCGESFTEWSDPVGHDIRAFEGKAATCDAEGYCDYEKCINGGCDYTTYKVISALGHDIKEFDDVQPTCTTAGVTDKVECQREGCTYAKQTKVPALGHFRITVDGKAATCTTDGYYPYEICTRSGCTGEGLAGKVVIEAFGHDNVSYAESEPTCTEFGWYAYTVCNRCQYSTYTQRNATGHSYDNGYCSCGHSDPGLHTHIWNSGEVVTAADCTSGGVMKYTCTDSNCGDTKTEAIAALGHDNVAYPEKAATCTEDGWYAYNECQRCGYNTRVVISALGHSYDAGVVTKQAGCTESGVRTFTCVRGDKSFDVSIDPIGHDYGAWCVSVEARCETDGENVRICQNDASHKEKEVILAIGHNWGEWTVALQPTCAEYGREQRICLNNSCMQTREINPTGNHSINSSTGICSTCAQTLKTPLATPEITAESGSIIYWNIVSGAAEYEVRVSQTDGVDTATVSATCIDLLPYYRESNTLQVFIRAIASEDGDNINSAYYSYIFTVKDGDIANYTALGKSVNLISNGYTEYMNKTIFNTALLNTLTINQIGEPTHYSEAVMHESIESYTASLTNSITKKFNVKASVGVGELFKVTNGYSYEIGETYQKNTYNETQAVFYDMNYRYEGYTVGIDDYISDVFSLEAGDERDAALAALTSKSFRDDAQRVQNGNMTVAAFINKYGTHVITQGVYGASFTAHYELLTDKSSASQSFSENVKLGITTAISGKLYGLDVGLETDSSLSLDTSRLTTECTSESQSKFEFIAYGGDKPANMAATSLADVSNACESWASTITNEDAYALIDVPDGSLYFIWDFLGSEFDDVKKALSDYFYRCCEEQTESTNSKVNGMYKDFFTFDEETGTLTFDIGGLQNPDETSTSLDGVYYTAPDGTVIFDGSNHVVMIYPKFNGYDVNKVVFKGAYQTEDKNNNGCSIYSEFNSITIKFYQNWSRDITIEFESFAYNAPAGSPALDLSAVSSENITIITTGYNRIKGGDGSYSGQWGSAGISADGKNLVIQGTGELEIVGGTGARGVDGNCADGDGDNGAGGTSGSVGGVGINAGKVTVSSGTVAVIGGVGGKGGSGGCCNPNWKLDGKEYGGSGGSGGTGGTGICADYIIVNGGSVTVTGGTGGKGGDAGGVYVGKDGFGYGYGYPGSFGSGGPGGASIDTSCFVSDSYSLATFTDGAAGATGDGYDCRDH